MRESSGTPALVPPIPPVDGGQNYPVIIPLYELWETHIVSSVVLYCYLMRKILDGLNLCRRSGDMWLTVHGHMWATQKCQVLKRNGGTHLKKMHSASRMSNLKSDVKSPAKSHALAGDVQDAGGGRAREDRKVVRPTLDDVQRLSEGRAAKTRGFGSRQIPHRLNQEERRAFDMARERGYLTLQGTGYRKERKGSPLANIYRQLCDVGAKPCIVVEQRSQGAGDVVVVDFSTLKLSDVTSHESCVREIIGKHDDVVEISRKEILSPFTILVPPFILDPQEGEEEDVLLHMVQAPMWQIPPQLLAVSCMRPLAKSLAKEIADIY